MPNLEARVTGRLAAAGAVMDREQVRQLVAYLELLTKWNRSINLTAFRLDPPADRAIDRLIVEAAIAARQVSEPAAVWFDLGSGGGSPAIPLKILQPSLRLTLVEATAKKAAFLREVIRALGISRTTVENSRFEDVGANLTLQATAGLVTARAVRTDASFFHAAAQLLAPTGELWLFLSARPGATSYRAESFRSQRSVTLASDSQLEILVPVLRQP